MTNGSYTDEHHLDSSVIWSRLRDLVIAVVVLCVLPYVDRQTAQDLGQWVLLAPAVGLSLLWLGGLFIYLDVGRENDRVVDRSSRSPSAPFWVFLFILTMVVLLSSWVMVTVWIAVVPTAAAPELGKTSDLDPVLAAPDVQGFATAGWSKGLPSAPDLARLDPHVRGALTDVSCTANPDPKDSALTKDFECVMPANAALERPACRLIWSLKPTLESTGSMLATAMNRQDVVTKFNGSGYGKFDLSGGGTAAPYMGVAFVACADGGLPSPLPDGNLRVAFVLADAEQIGTRHYLFRTVGFDWVAKEHFAKPYMAELFALSSLYQVSHIIFSDTTRFADRMTSSAKHDLFGVAEISALRREPWTEVRVSNVSDGQLGNSRGSCLLVADVSGLTASMPRLHVSPSAITPDLSTADRSLVLLPSGVEPISLPCALVSALVTRDMTAASDYPPELTGTRVNYYPERGESLREAQRRGYNVRAAALTLYLLGFHVTYDAEKKAGQVGGSWPRSEFVAASKIP